MKKFISLMLAMIMMFTMCISASAAENDATITILKNTPSICVVQEVTESGITIAINNKETNILTIEYYDSTKSNLLSINTLDLEAITTDIIENNNSQNVNTRSTHVYQHTFSNREYDIYMYDTYTSWKIRSDSNYKTVTEKSSNSSYLESFRSAVEDVNSAEFTLIGAVGATVAATAITAFLSGGLAAGIAAAGGSAGATAAFASLNSAINSADYYFARVN